MKKLKFFLSVLKERDWLEDMARQGYLLNDIKLGILYKFDETKPCEKVYEIERFAINANREATKQELTAKENAIDIANQTGWKVVTHDEMMNYYFIKDKAGDETDEFYEDEASRLSRAEKYRKEMSITQPKTLLSLLMCIAALYIPLFILCRNDAKNLSILMWIFIVVSIIEVGISLFSIIGGEITYNDLILSRAEWEAKKKYSEKKNFKKTKELIDFLSKKNDEGLVLSHCKDGIYYFEPSDKKYTYYADTISALNKRNKKKGNKLVRDSKDIEGRGLKWQEQSIREARKLGLEIVCCASYGTLIYRKKADNNYSAVTDSENETSVFNAVTTGYGDSCQTMVLFGVLMLVVIAIAITIAILSK